MPANNPLAYLDPTLLNGQPQGQNGGQQGQVLQSAQTGQNGGQRRRRNLGPQLPAQQGVPSMADVFAALRSGDPETARRLSALMQGQQNLAGAGSPFAGVAQNQVAPFQSFQRPAPLPIRRFLVGQPGALFGT